MGDPYQILYLEDSPTDARWVQDLLAAASLPSHIAVAADREAFESLLERRKFDLLLLDYNLPGYSGLAALRQAQKLLPELPAIIISGALNPDEAVECLRLGAADYLLKDRLERLPSAIQRAVGAAQEKVALHSHEEALRESDAHNRQIIDNALDAVVTMDLGGKITGWNRQAEILFGWSSAEAVGRLMSELIIPLEMRARHEIGLQRLRESGVGRMFNRRLEMPALRRHGDIIQVELALIRFTSGHATYFSAFLRDISEQKRAEQALRENEARFRAVLEHLADGVIVVATDGQILEANPRLLQLLGCSREQLLQKNRRDLFADDLPFQPFLAGIDRNVSHYRTRFTSVAGRVLELEISRAELLDAHRKPSGWVEVIRDITERVQGERVALRTQRLQSLGTLAGGIAHDLNNALAPIIMGAELLKASHPEEAKAIEVISTSAKRAADMVLQLVNFAKGAAGERCPLRPVSLVHELERIIKASFPKNIEFQLRVAPALPLVLGDATQLHQVLLNLCVNARDAMPDGGRLEIDLEAVSLDVEAARQMPDGRPGNFVVFKVTDTGTGIPPEIIDRVFDPFFTTKSPEHGTGLGLSNVLGIVKGHGGFVHVYSSVGRGSAFRVYLPSEFAAVPELSPLAEVEFFGQGQTVLFVDDERMVREAGLKVLKRLNFKPIAARDGLDALIQLAERRDELACIISDWDMPGLGRIEFLHAIRRMLPETPILVISGRVDDRLQSETSRLRHLAVLSKPFDQGQLSKALRQLLTPPPLE